MEVENLVFNVKRTGDVAGNSMHGLSKALQSVSGSSKGAGKSIASLMNTITRMAKLMVLRQTIRGLIQALDEGTKNAYMFSKVLGGDLAASLDMLATKNYTASNQIGAAWATLLQTIQPILLKIIELIRRAAEIITQFFALLGGKRTYLKAIDYSKSWADTTAKGAAAAKEWKNQLMGFDEINRLEEPAETGGGGGAATPDYSQMFEEIPISSKFTDFIDTIKAHLADLELFAEGAMLGIGLILALSGANVPLGLGLIALGAYGLCKNLSENWEYLTGNTMGVLSVIDNLINGLEFGVGLILALSGANVPLGLGLMALGAVGFAGNAAINWDNMPNKAKRVIKNIETALGIGLLGVGAILTFTGANIPLGLGLMASGAALLGKVAALSEGKIVETVAKTLGAIMELVGPALTAVGLLLLLFPGAWPIAGALIAAGLMTTGAGMMLNPNPVIEMINGVIVKAQELFNWARNATLQLNEMFKAGGKADQAAARRMEAGGGMYAGMNFATGGFPDEGELFMAREAGPELVGRIGNRTAVANNDQIISGIRQGVYEAVSQAMGNQSGGEVVLKLDGDVLARGVTKYQRFSAISANL